MTRFYYAHIFSRHTQVAVQPRHVLFSSCPVVAVNILVLEEKPFMYVTYGKPKSESTISCLLQVAYQVMASNYQ